MAGCPTSDEISAVFPPSARVRTKREFDRIFEHGRRTATPMLTLHFLADTEPSRLGLAVSRKVDRRAVARNRIKRLIRERFRQSRISLAPGAYVVVARASAAKASASQLIAAFEQALIRAGALPTISANGTMPPAFPSSAQASNASGASSSPAP